MIKKEELSNPNSCINKATADEMVFVLLERDPAAAKAIQSWIEERVRLGLNKWGDRKLTEAARVATQMNLKHTGKKS